MKNNYNYFYQWLFPQYITWYKVSSNSNNTQCSDATFAAATGSAEDISEQWSIETSRIRTPFFVHFRLRHAPAVLYYFDAVKKMAPSSHNMINADDGARSRWWKSVLSGELFRKTSAIGQPTRPTRLLLLSRQIQPQIRQVVFHLAY